MGQPRYRRGFEPTLHDDVLELPLKWRKPRLIFVNSMSDLFHEDVPDGFLRRVFEVMRRAHWHSFQILTKRSERLARLSPTIDWPDNVWMGVSVESSKYLPRVDELRSTQARVRFLSLEPLLGPLPGLNLSGIHWVIVGGESGPGSRPMLLDWVLEIRDRCRCEGVPFFFKQWGGANKKRTGRMLQGRTWNEMPLAELSCASSPSARA
jgi:protein gp37